MSALARLQHDFLAALFDEAPSADPGVQAYRRNVLGTFHNALALTYPVVRRLVGEAFFREAAEQFARMHPSRSGDLAEYGGALAQFLAAYPHGRDLGYLPDVARLEWAVHECEREEEAAGLDYAALARIPPERHGGIRFRLDRAARLVASPWPILALWEANQPERDGTPARTEGGERVLVRREGHDARLESLGEDDWRFLSALAGGETLEAAGEAMSDGGLLAQVLARHAASGVVAGFDAPA